MKNMDSDAAGFTAKKAAKFKQYMSSEKRDMSYIMAFGTYELIQDEWKIDDVHVSEDLLSVGTLEMIDMFFSISGYDKNDSTSSKNDVQEFKYHEDKIRKMKKGLPNRLDDYPDISEDVLK